MENLSLLRLSSIVSFQTIIKRGFSVLWWENREMSFCQAQKDNSCAATDLRRSLIKLSAMEASCYWIPELSFYKRTCLRN